MPNTPALTEAATRAPADAGVYFLLGTDDELLYVGKAANLRRRLGDHARSRSRGLGLRWEALLESVRVVRWEVCGSEEAALSREADPIVLLRPPFNASHTEQDPHRYLSVAEDTTSTTFGLTGTLHAPGRVYGCFPHLAQGAFSHAAKRTKTGYTALLRLLWVSQSGDPDRIPSRIAGASPPNRHRAPPAPEHRTLVHDYFSGRSVRLVRTLDATIAAADIPAYMRPALARDVVSARAFFDLGPRRIRQFRLRHELPAGAVPVDVMAELLTQELRVVIARA